MKKVLSRLKSILASIDQLQVTQTDFPSGDLPPSDATMLASITSNIRDDLPPSDATILASITSNIRDDLPSSDATMLTT